MLDIVDKPAGKQLHLPGNITLSLEYDRFLIGLNPVEECPFPVLEGESILNVPGETIFSGWRIRVDVLPGEKMDEPAIMRHRVSTSTKADEPDRYNTTLQFSAFVDFDRVGDSLKVRSVQAGDRF